MSSAKLPATFKAAVIESANAPFKLVDKPLEQPKAGQVLVKVLACGVCHSDLLVKAGNVPLPKTAGHEVIGDVAAVGPGETRWKVGDRIGAGWHGGHCFNCDRCLVGDFITCDHANVNGISSDGGYAEYAILRTESLAAVSRNIDPAEAAPLMCAGVTVFNSLRNMNLSPGELIAVQGVGGLGHLAIQYARKMGYRVAVLSSGSSKQAAAKELGANYYLDGSVVDQGAELRKLGGAKVVVCTAPNKEIIQKLVPGINADGTLLLLAVIHEPVSIPVMALIGKRINVRGWPSGNPKDSEDAISFAQETDVKCLVEKYPLADVEKAFERMMSGQSQFRVVVIP